MAYVERVMSLSKSAKARLPKRPRHTHHPISPLHNCDDKECIVPQHAYVQNDMGTCIRVGRSALFSVDVYCTPLTMPDDKPTKYNTKQYVGINLVRFVRILMKRKKRTRNRYSVLYLVQHWKVICCRVLRKF